MKDGREVANYVLDYADEHGVSVTNLSLQKILYFCHAYYLVSTGRPLLRHLFEAWEYGPVLPYLYREFREFGDKKITARAFKLDIVTGERVLAELVLPENDESLLRSILAFCCRFSAIQLVEQSHMSGGPWYRVWYHEGSINPGMKINNDEILRFYSSGKSSFALQ